jgi:hypothetical protein
MHLSREGLRGKRLLEEGCEQGDDGSVRGSRAATLDGGGGKLDGQGGIRTHDTREGIPVFETGSFSHSDTCPGTGQLLSREKFSRLGSSFPVALLGR